MSDHEFEKRVQQKMDGLNLRPSDAVWVEVERNLRREKRRRRTLLWLPLMALLLTAGGFIIFSGNGTTGDNALVSKQSTEKDAELEEAPSLSISVTPSTTPEPSSSQKTNLPSSPDNSTQPADQPKQVETATEKNNNSIIAGNKHKNIPQKQRTGNKQRDISNDLDAVTVNGNRKGKKSSADKTVNDKETVQPDATLQQDALKNQGDPDPVVDKTNDTKDAGDKPVVKPPVDSTVKSLKASDSAKKAAAPPAIVKAPAKKKQPSISKFQWGVNANASFANIVEGNFFSSMQKSRVEDLTDAAPSYAGIPPVPSPEPSTIRQGPAFSVGGFVQTKLSKRISVSAGLQYSYITVNTRVGKKVDSLLAVNYGATNTQVLSTYYRGINAMHDYTNRYHFIELPVTASLRLTGSKLPITLDAGVSFSRLMNTNALHFDGIGGVYYENDDFFKKMQFSLNAGLSVGFLQKSKHPVFIGPNLRYFTTSLLDEGVSASAGKQHIWSYGINARVLLKK